VADVSGSLGEEKKGDSLNSFDLRKETDAILSTQLSAGRLMFPAYLHEVLRKQAAQEFRAKVQQARQNGLKVNRDAAETLLVDAMLAQAPRLCQKADDLLTILVPFAPAVGEEVMLDDFPEMATVVSRLLQKKPVGGGMEVVINYLFPKQGDKTFVQHYDVTWEGGDLEKIVEPLLSSADLPKSPDLFDQPFKQLQE